MSDSLRSNGLPRPSLNPQACSNSCPSSQWLHPTISSSVVPFFSCLQSCPTSGSFQMSQLFASGGQNIKSFSFNISPSNEYSELISFRMNWFISCYTFFIFSLFFLPLTRTSRKLFNSNGSYCYTFCYLEIRWCATTAACFQVLSFGH